MNRFLVYICKVMRKSCIISSIALILLLMLCSAQTPPERQSLRVMSWNVENLFDTLDDEGFRDEEFLPQSDHRWTSHRYWQKLTDVARVFAAVSDDDRLPDLVGLCEVENDSAMTALTRRSVLRHLHYDYVMTHSPDARGIDVALLYQPARFRLLSHRSIRIPSSEHGLRATRDILYVKGLVATASGTDTLHVMVVHLPSRAGGHTGDQNRRLAAATLWGAVDSLLNRAVSGAAPPIVVMGDFNAPAKDRIFRQSPLRLTDDPKSPGTYSFRGIWQWIDHILVTPSMTTTVARPVRLPWLLEENKSYGGQTPRRPFRGPSYHGGISDHLPVVIDIEF